MKKGLCAIWISLALVTSAYPSAASLQKKQRATRHFDFYFDPSIEPSISGLIARSESHRASILRDLGERELGRTRVIMTHDFDDFRTVQPRGFRALEWMAAVAFPSRNLVVIRADARLLPQIDQTFLHEFSHIALMRSFPRARLPHWFIEGFAELQAKEFSLEQMRQFLGHAVGGTLYPLAELDHRFPSHHRQVSLAYAQSSVFVAWLKRRGGTGGFRKLWAEMARGASFHFALQRAYGTTLDALETEWRRELTSLSSGYLFTGELALWGLIALLFVYVGWHSFRRRRHALSEIPHAGDEDDQEVVILRPH
ncbi:MAG: hypothetical protein KC609_16390 [Myxococcales bacterium]|nr:hypothetical protein [Myxococcales bacterium]